MRESVLEGQFQAPTDLVFGNRRGTRCGNPSYCGTVLQPAAEAAGLGRPTRHQFRHIHSSLLNDLNVPVKIAQEQLGHASISTTLNIYTHVVDASHRKAVEAVGERLFFELDPNGPKNGELVAHDFADKQQELLGFELEEKRLRPQASAGGKS